MVNSVRTCLLNASHWTGVTNPVCEEYVPASYTPKQLTGTLLAASNLLFGAGADRVGSNITLARLLSYVHGSNLLPIVTVNDSRITYDPYNGSSVFDGIGPQVTGASIVGWLGTSGFILPGRGFGLWIVTTDGAGNYTVTPGDGSGVLSGSVQVLTNGDAIPLAGSFLSLIVTHNAANTCNVSLVVPPTHTFTDIVNLPDASTLFRPQGSASDQTLYQAWINSSSDQYRAAAAALALAQRILEI